MITIDEARCIGCLKCFQVCPLKVLAQHEKKVTVSRPDLCIRCGHCMSVCPTQAVEGTFDDSQIGKKTEGLSLPSSEEVENLMMTRRSIRAYENRRVEKDLLKKLLILAAHAPTGSNAQNVKYFVVGEKGCTQLEAYAQEHYLTQASGKTSLIVKEANFQVLLGAPALIGLYSEKDRGRWSCAMAAQNIVLAAHSMGLGTCYNGIFLKAYLHDQRIHEYFNLPDQNEMYMFLSIGYPKASITYNHTIKRKAPDTLWKE